MDKDSQCLTVGQLADRWQKSDQWIYSNYRRIGLRVLKIGQQLRFPEEEVRKWEQSHLTENKIAQAAAQAISVKSNPY